MKVQEARALNAEQISAELVDLRRKLFTLSSQTVTEKVEDNSQFGKIRKDIARLLTIQNEQRTNERPKKTAGKK